MTHIPLWPRQVIGYHRKRNRSEGNHLVIIGRDAVISSIHPTINPAQVVEHFPRSIHVRFCSLGISENELCPGDGRE